MQRRDIQFVKADHIHKAIKMRRQMFSYLIKNNQDWCGIPLPSPAIEPHRGRETLYDSTEAEQFITAVQTFYDDHVCAEEIADRLQVSSQTVWSSIKRGKIWGVEFCKPVGKYNGRWWWKRDEFNECINAIKTKRLEMSV